MHRTQHIVRVGLMVAAVGAAAGCSNYRDSRGDENIAATRAESRIDAAERAVQDFRRRDPSLSRFFDTAHGYAVFPKVTKGAVGLGAAHGEGGVVFERGKVVGFSELTQVTVGAQLGGQDFQELIFFEDAAALQMFKSGKMEFAANASAVAATSGAAASSDFDHGVAVFTMPLGGLMFEAAIGGQKFTYAPRESAYATAP